MNFGICIKIKSKVIRPIDYYTITQEEDGGIRSCRLFLSVCYGTVSKSFSFSPLYQHKSKTHNCTTLLPPLTVTDQLEYNQRCLVL